ncbi:MAG: hypothetical protein ABIR96_07220, partial [Bdellovibrionota bacterium]
MKTQITASVFWQLFKSSAIAKDEIPEIEHLRHRCLLGFTALDAALYTFWSSAVVPEWNEVMSLVSMTLESASSSETLDRLTALVGPQLKKSQLVATLRFISNTGEASRFTPNFLDFAAYLLIRTEENSASIEIVRSLCELQACRNSAIHTGRPWSEIQAHRSLKVIEETARALSLVSASFNETFGSGSVI